MTSIARNGITTSWKFDFLNVYLLSESFMSFDRGGIYLQSNQRVVSA